MTCNACTAPAILVYRLVPYQAMTLFDATPRDVAACKAHLGAVRKIGHVLAATPLSSDVVTRVVQP